CATSFVRGDFEFEVALHQLSGLGTKDKPFVMRQLFDKLGVLDKVEFVQEHDLYRLVVPGELDVTLPASWTGLRNLLQGMFPAESEAIERFLLVCEKVSLEGFMTLPKARKANSDAALQSLCPYY
ncbi:NAD(P)/FAD-dependent oxidoreductase, partial [Klebsiella pneumoniae]|nr:NAD(P)/FAD-dependent oxidoreductase [Klebsiella pneumoniae]